MIDTMCYKIHGQIEDELLWTTIVCYHYHIILINCLEGLRLENEIKGDQDSKTLLYWAVGKDYRAQQMLVKILH